MNFDSRRRQRVALIQPSSRGAFCRRLRVEQLEERRLLAAVITVNSTADTDARDAFLTLREAILINNRTLATGLLSASEQSQVAGAPTAADADSIHFNIPGAGLHTISPTSALPTITDPVLIDGYTQAGASANSAAPNQALNTVLRIELAGNLAGSDAHGLFLGAGSGGSTIRGLAINRFVKNGIQIENAGGNTIAGNFIGTSATGTAAASNNEGVFIVSSANNTIGGLTPAAANLISGNTLGAVVIINTPSTGNKVQGNRIGVDVTGTVDLGNGGGVVSFQGAGTIVGGTAPGTGNLISGNNGNGVWILGGSNNSVIQGNTIGTNLAGTAALGNGRGVFIENALNAQIGGAEPGAGNVISASSSEGILLDGTSDGAVIKGNLIGTDRTGMQPLGNGGRGISVPNSSRTTIGGLAPGDGNVIARSGESAIIIQNGTGHMILGNKIGTDLSGTLNLGNTGGVNLTVGSSMIKGNVIAFNNSGLSLSGNTFGIPETGNLLSQNSIHSNLNAIQLDLSPPGGPNFPQDATDDDTGGANNLQNFPIITSVTDLGTTTRVVGTFTSRLNSNYRLEFFASAAHAGSGFGPGQTFLDDLDLSIGAGGNTVPFSIDLPALPAGQPYVTATATDITIAGGGPRNDTSEFSPAVPIDTVFIVTGTASSITLSQALGAANYVAGPQTISFNIPPTDPNHVYYKNDGVPGQVSRANIATTTAANDANILDIDPDWPHSWFSIELDSQLLINEQTVIDGYTQPGAIANTNPVGQGLNSVLRIEINGTGAGNFRPQLDGLIHVNTSNSTLRGLVVNRADGQSIQLRSGTGNTIAGNYIGTDVSGTHVFRNEFGESSSYAGVGVDDNPANSTTGHRIGGVTPAARNLLSGNLAGVEFHGWATSIFVEGNLIGTNRAGTQPLGNGTGVFAAGGVTVGGAAPGAGNLISGNTTGVVIGNNTLVENNRIGTDVTGAAPVPNEDGIQVGGNNNVVRGNTIAFSRRIDALSRGIGVSIGAPRTGNLLSQNSIFSNAALGIDLGLQQNGHPDGVSLNDVPPASDPPDKDTGGNDGQNYPTITSALPVGGGVEVQGTLASTPNSSFRIELFANRERDENIFTFDGTIKPGMFAQGETYLGFATATTNASGLATFTANLPLLPPDQDFITATATDVTNTLSGPRNNTSEFSPVYPLGGPSTVVTKTGDVGVGTLREAIFVANLTAGPNTITFNIPANDPRHFYYQNDGVAGRVSLASIAVTSATNDAAIAGIDPEWPHSWFSIQPMRNLPNIVDTVAINGYSQSGSSVNTLELLEGLNTVLKIELDGTNAPGDGLRLTDSDGVGVNFTDAGHSRISGLAINRFGGNGLTLNTVNGHNTIAGNYIGTDVSGSLLVGNSGDGVFLDHELSTLVGGDVTDGNDLIGAAGGVSAGGSVSSGSSLISGNGGYQLQVDGGANNVISKMHVALVRDAKTGKTGYMTFIDIQPALKPPVCVTETKPRLPPPDPPTHPSPAACIVDSALGASGLGGSAVFSVAGRDELQAYFSKNIIVKPEPDRGQLQGIRLENDANGGLSHPNLGSATTTGAATTVNGTLNSVPNSTFQVELYSNTVGPSFQAGEVYLGSVTLTTNAAGTAAFTFNSPLVVPAGQFVTSIASELHPETLRPLRTSEFSVPIIVNPRRGDFNASGEIDAADYVVWRNTRGQTVAPFAGADGSGNGLVDQADYDIWRANFGKTWSPAGASTAVLGPTAEGEQTESITTASSTTMSADTHSNHAESTDTARRAFVANARSDVQRVADRPALTTRTTLLPTSTPYDEALTAWLTGNALLRSAANRERLDRPANPSPTFDHEVTSAIDSNLDGLDAVFGSIGEAAVL